MQKELLNRREWVQLLVKVATPVWKAAAEGTLKQKLPVERHANTKMQRDDFACLEAVGRSFSGIASWLDNDTVLDVEERQNQETLRDYVIQGFGNLFDSERENLLNFDVGDQPVVDTAFLAQGFLRAPGVWNRLDTVIQTEIISSMKCSRKCRVFHNNWLLFGGIIEAFLMSVGEEADSMRIDYAIRQHEQWYLGGGIYGDGPEFHSDYYNSYVIHPMLLDIIITVGKHTDRWESFRSRIIERAKQYARIQEQSIHPDGSYPPFGRSITYRCGAFHLLAQSALRGDLPESVSPAAARKSLSAVISKTLNHSETFDENGWLQIGLCGHQPELAENYICTGSLYLCLCAFLPLGLGEGEAFWSDELASLTQEKLWAPFR